MMSTGTTIDTGTPTNNWLITPELSGEEQTVSFWVNAPGDEVSRGEQNPNSGPETFDLYYSEDDTNPNSFIKINKDSYEAVYDWKQYNIYLPEGAKYFAIVHTSTGSLTSYNYEPDRVCVDDVTYRAGGLRVMGYNVYRDGAKINNELVTEPTYTDLDLGNNTYNYNVTAVYEGGESALSNDYTITLSDSSVGELNADAVRVVVRNRLVASFSAGALTESRVYNPGGALVAQGSGWIALPTAGVYFVENCSGKATKIIVR